MVYLLTKDTNITSYIMFYIADLNYYKHLKDIIHNRILTELQIFHISRYVIAPRKFHRGKDDTYDKGTMLNVHTYLMERSTKNTFFISNFLYDRMKILRQYCQDYLNNNVLVNNIIANNRFIGKFIISSIVPFCNKNAYIQYRFHHS